MMNFHKVRLCLLLFTVVVSSGARILPRPQSSRIDHPLLFFKATKGNTNIYLYGAIHGMFKPEIGYPLPLRILEAFDESDHVFVMQLPENSTELYDAVAQSHEPWENSIGETQAQALTALLDTLQVNEDQRENLLAYEPWILLSLLYQLFIYELGYNAQPEYEYFEQRANELDLNLEQVLIFEAEMDFIATLSKNHGAELYEWFFNRFLFFQRGFNLAEALQSAWLKGNVITTLDQLVLSRSPQLEALRTIEVDLYTKINDYYWQAISPHLSNNDEAQQLFIVLPADYLLDNGGLAQFLESQAFTITRA